jgi:TRAP-type mannitol/chloroaromatic compound transport system permease small subunit
MKEATDAGSTPARDAVGAAIEIAARAAAVFGGLVLTLAMLVTVVSIIGRMLLQIGNLIPGLGWLGPVPGDYEIVEMGAAIAVAASLPMCQLRGGHVIVDLFFSGSGPRALAFFSFLGNLLFAIVGAVIVWRLYLGAMSKFQYHESTMILGIEVGWGYLALSVFFGLAVLCAAYLAIRDLAAISRTPRV